MAGRLATLAATALVSTLAACAAPPVSQGEESATGLLRLGRRCDAGRGGLTLDARFDVTGPVALELDTHLTNPQTRELRAGNYAIAIRPDFRLWRDVAVAQLQVAAELVSNGEQLFEIAPGASTLVAYNFMVEGDMATFDSD